jgi:two-component system sensor histidine kinase KdpD
MGRRGTLRVYLGAAPGVGKTFAMLNEGRRARERGADLVVGFVETHGRERTAEQIGDLEVVPRRRIDYRGTTFEEMDLDAVLARHPERVLADELAHTNVPGCRNAKRWQDIEELLDAGIDVISTVNIQHLESLNDVVEQITGVVQRETVPDSFVRSADQIELVDQTPEALRRRMAHGNIYGPEKIDAALANYFRVGNLTALRELALLWLADRVDDALEDYRARHGISQPWETRERVVVALTGAPGREHVIRRAARIAQRAHGELIGVHVQRDDGLAGPSNENLDRHRELLRELGGTYRAIAGADIAAALVGFARSENATQIVLGATSRSRWQELTQGSIINRVVRLSGTIDVHVISQDPDEQGARFVMPKPSRSLLAPLPPRRRMTAFLLAAIGLPLQTVVLAAARDSVGLPSVLLLYLVTVLAVGAVGGALPALCAAVSAFLLANWYFTPPLYRFTVGERENVLALVIFVVAASLVSYLVDVAARRREELTRVRVEAEAMARMAGSLTREDVLGRFVDQVRVTFGAHGVAVLREGDGGRRQVEASAGEPVPTDPGAADAAASLGPGRTLVVDGVSLDAEDDRLLRALAAQTALALETRRLQHEAARATELAQANDLRASLLQAVSHDLRTPLAAIKAAITSLRQTDLAWEPAQVAEFQATVEDETDRLTALVESLLDMSRLQAGVLAPVVRETSLEEVLPEAVAGLGPRSRSVVIDVPEDLPTVAADPQLLGRVVANLVDNAITYSGGATPPRVTAGAVAGRVLLRVVDQGPGIDPKAREDVFRPFQRLVDHGTGVGLGLAIARGLTEAMGGELSIEDTPGGGTTMVVTLDEAARVLSGDKTPSG